MVATWFISTAFFGVYGMAIDTIFLCFLEDSERHDGSAEKPYYMSKKLKKILGKKNKSDDEDDSRHWLVIDWLSIGNWLVVNG